MNQTVLENKSFSLRDLQAAVARKENEDQRCKVLGKSLDASALNALKADLAQRLECKAEEEATCQKILDTVATACQSLVSAGEAILVIEEQHASGVNTCDALDWGTSNIERVRGLARVGGASRQ